MSNLKSDKNIIGIDFSLNGPGFCILTEDSAKWISLHRTSNNIPKMLKKLGSPFNTFSGSEHVSINIIDKETYSGEYYDKERQKILNAIYFSDIVMDLLDPYLNEDTLVGMEGFSFASNGNSLIDIVTTSTLVRSAIVKKINPNNFFIISPTTIKKYAVKGNAKKFELYDKIIESEDKRLLPLTNTLKINKSVWVKPSGKVDDPCSDIIDATWISLFVEENFKKLL
jgi:hypothetical protein